MQHFGMCFCPILYQFISMALYMQKMILGSFLEADKTLPWCHGCAFGTPTPIQRMDFCLLGDFHGFPVSLWVSSGFVVSIQKHWWPRDAQLPQECDWCPAMDRCPIQDIYYSLLLSAPRIDFKSTQTQNKIKNNTNRILHTVITLSVLDLDVPV